MTTHQIPADVDLIALVELNRLWEREDALSALEADLEAVWPVRRAERIARQPIYTTRREREHRARIATFKGDQQ